MRASVNVCCINLREMQIRVGSFWDPFVWFGVRVYLFRVLFPILNVAMLRFARVAIAKCCCAMSLLHTYTCILCSLFRKLVKTAMNIKKEENSMRIEFSHLYRMVFSFSFNISKIASFANASSIFYSTI